MATLAARYDAGEASAVAPTWRIAENRFSALRHGVEGTMVELAREIEPKVKTSNLDGSAKKVAADEL